MALETATPIKFCYQKSPDTAELARLVLAHLNMSYEEILISDEDYEKHMKGAPHCELPYIILEDGNYLYGGSTIARHLSQQYHLAGETYYENSILACAVELSEEIVQLGLASKNASSPESKQAAIELFMKEAPSKLATLDSKVKDGHVEGIYGKNGANYADLVVYCVVGIVEKISPGIASNCKHLLSIREYIPTITHTANYIEKRRSLKT